MENDKKVKTVVITGGNRGIGEGIARDFHSQGYYVVLGARTDTNLESTLGERICFQKMDVRKEAGHEKLAEKALELTGQIDVYINCAGFSKWSPIENVDENFWNDMIDTNLKGVFFGCKVAAKLLKDKGCILNVSSLAGKRGSADNSVYCASKFGVNGITQSLAKELGPRGIRVNAVCPVYVRTLGLMEALNEQYSPAKGKNVDLYLQKFVNENTALQRLPTVQEIARICFFLASDKASAITGQCINVDCGVMPQ
ncbi:MAG: SDR family oxidoreductase [bacterium]